jgi:CheY-like chemotaxis protein
MSHSGLHLLRPFEAASEAAADTRSLRPRLLLVDDEDAIRESLGEALEEDGFEVVMAANGKQALDFLRHNARPSAILLDLMMPVMDGWEFRHAQLSDPLLREIPVLVISASGSSAQTLRLQLGDVELIPKPVPYGGLLKVLGRACGLAASAA